MNRPTPILTRLPPLLLLLLAACGNGEPRESAPTPATDPVSVASPPADAASGSGDTSSSDGPWVTGMARREHGAVGSATVSGARAARHEGFDRLVIEFSTDAIPTYQVEFIEGPAVQCGSGNEIELEGGGILMVRLEGANAHDEDGNATIEERRLDPNLPVLLEARLICDFEGYVDWALGVAERTAFRVIELTEPTRLAVDVQH